MRRLALALSLALLGACTGTDVGNPPRGGLSSFDTPGCKSAASDVKGVDPGLRTWLPDQTSYGGLQCFLWDRLEDGKLRVRVTNYAAGCHSDEGWEPRVVRRSAAEVDLLLESPECLVAGCGWCIYDLLFVLDAKFASQPQLGVNLLEDPDCSSQPRRDSVTLALAERASGAVCNYANPSALNWALTQRAGSERMPCGAQRAACVAGTSCTPVDSAGKYQELALCLAPCASDADCSPGELMRCKQGTCQLADPR